METSESPLLIGGRGPGGKFLSGTKKVIIRWSFLELGSYGNIGMLCLVSLKNLLLNSSMPCTDELHLWQAADAKGLRALGLGQVV
jgi:hypothetical protein